MVDADVHRTDIAVISSLYQRLDVHRMLHTDGRGVVLTTIPMDITINQLDVARIHKWPLSQLVHFKILLPFDRDYLFRSWCYDMKCVQAGEVLTSGSKWLYWFRTAFWTPTQFPRLSDANPHWAVVDLSAFSCRFFNDLFIALSPNASLVSSGTFII